MPYYIVIVSIPVGGSNRGFSGWCRGESRLACVYRVDDYRYHYFQPKNKPWQAIFPRQTMRCVSLLNYKWVMLLLLRRLWIANVPFFIATQSAYGNCGLCRGTSNMPSKIMRLIQACLMACSLVDFNGVPVCIDCWKHETLDFVDFRGRVRC